MSLSARRAWIEILDDISLDYKEVVALRKESVDRNDAVQIIVVIVYASLSARRAWIEIDALACLAGFVHCRSPQGERG